ncbi:MAG: glycosyltransferase family 4 protein [Isosphaeraceae bacterium]
MQHSKIKWRVLVACPDARPPAYQAAVGMSRSGLLGGFVTASYYNPRGAFAGLLRRIAGRRFARIERVLLRRHDPEIPSGRVQPMPSFDLALRLEGFLARKSPRLKRAVARWRTARFDAAVARVIRRDRPDAVVVFSDVGSEKTLPLCKKLEIPTILSMVHGDVREEAELLETEASAAADFMPIYLGDGALDRDELAWLHRRRLQDIELADRVLVPSEHIANTLARQGMPRDRILVIPYAADCRRFRPVSRAEQSSCTFLFAGGITQRKGIKYLLEAWLRIRRSGWTLQLLGPLPRAASPLAPYLDLVEPLGRVSHAEMPERMAAADVFVFPSLFEGSAVVTYEALACGLPSVVTPGAGSVVRDGVEGFIVPPRDVDALAERMERLGCDPALRARMARAARARALEFDWPRYHASLITVVDDLVSSTRKQKLHRSRQCGSHRLAETGQTVPTYS